MQEALKAIEEHLGFIPCEPTIRHIHEHCLGKAHTYEEVEKIFHLNQEPNFQTGVSLSAFDLCRIPITTFKQTKLPEIAISEPGSETAAARPRSTGSRSFIDQYITEIAVFPTLSREEEIELAKLMEIAYIRYKHSLCFCPLVLDWLDEEFEQISESSSENQEFHLSRFKSLVVPGTSKMSYNQLWSLFKRNWEIIRKLRSIITEYEGRLEEGVSKKEEKKIRCELDILRFAAAFLIKDINIRENVFHEFREQLLDHRDDYPEYAYHIKQISKKYVRYIECKNMLVNFNLKLVVSIARKFFRGSIAPMDIVQYGNQGLIRAAEDFNYKLNFKFSTYAIWWIRQKIQEGIQEQERLIRIPAYKLHLSRKFSAVKDRIFREKNLLEDDDQNTDEEIEQAEKLKNIPQAFVVSPQASDGTDEEGGQFLEQVADSSLVEEDKVFDEDAQAALRMHLRLYPVRERYILILRYGLQCDDIFPTCDTQENLERKYQELKRTLEKESDEDEFELTDKILDAEMEKIPFTFLYLPTEIRIPIEDFRAINKDKVAEEAVAQTIFPYEKEELEKVREKHKLQGSSFTDREKTLLALVDGVDFAEQITMKPKDRVILKHQWLHKDLKPSVARHILSNEGLILEDVADIFGLTKERVRQIEAKILRHISYHLVLP